MSDILLVGPKVMLVGHEGRTWSQGGLAMSHPEYWEFVLTFWCNPQTHQSGYQRQISQ